MTWSKFFYGTQDFLYDYCFPFYDNIGNIFNYSCIVLGFVGLFYWLNLQNKFNKAAAGNSSKIK
jgi:hypothetical protein